MSKREALQELARKRQRAKWPGYNNLGDYHDGAYECPHVSPYTKSAGDVDAQVMVMLQDWKSDDNIRRKLDEDALEYGYTKNYPTNKNLIRLLNEYFGVSLKNIFATNLFPFIKPGDMGTTIPRRDLVRAAEEFALPQIRIVQPRLVICLGLNTYNALREACQESRISRMSEAIATPFDFDGARIWCQAHTGGRGQANRGRKLVSDDWRAMQQDMIKGGLGGLEDRLPKAA
jgi:uracil-DNA glycosylase